MHNAPSDRCVREQQLLGHEKGQKKKDVIKKY